MEFDQDLLIFWLSALGFASLCHFLFGFSKWFYKMFVRAPKYLCRYGSWAMITGSTDGIGKALAFELASKGLNLVCVGRNPAKLESTEAEIHQRFGDKILIRNIIIDFAKATPDEISSAIEHGIKGLDVGVLVNNVGITYSYPRFFHETELELMDRVIRVNIGAMIWVTKAVIPNMMKKKKGAIVNIGSGSSASVSAFPLFTIYAASKAFMATFSRSIYLEYRNHGINVQCQAPLYTTTKMTTKLSNNMLKTTAEEYSRWSVRWIGHGDPLCCPALWHSLQSYASRSVLDPLVVRQQFKTFLKIRRKALIRKINRRNLIDGPATACVLMAT